MCIVQIFKRLLVATPSNNPRNCGSPSIWLPSCVLSQGEGRGIRPRAENVIDFRLETRALPTSQNWKKPRCRLDEMLYNVMYISVLSTHFFSDVNKRLFNSLHTETTS